MRAGRINQSFAVINETFRAKVFTGNRKDIEARMEQAESFLKLLFRKNFNTLNGN